MRPFRVVLLFIVLSLAALSSIPLLQVNLLPKDKGRYINISFNAPGYSPEQTEKQVTSVLENVLSKVRNVKKINSQSGHSTGSLSLSFDQHSDIELQRLEVSSLLRQVYPSLPKNVSYPLLSVQSQGSKTVTPDPLLIYTLSQERTNGLTNINEVKEVLLKKINAIEGVEKVEFSNVDKKLISIQYDIDKLNALHLSRESIVSTLTNGLSDVSAGSISWNGQTSLIRLAARTNAIEDLDQLNLQTSNGNVVSLGQIAKINVSPIDPSSYYRINGREAERISIFTMPGANELLVSSTIKNIIAGLEPTLIHGYRFNLSHDDTAFLQHEMEKNYIRIALAMAILMAFIFISYRSWRHLLNLFATLLVNLCLTLLLCWLLDVDIHMYTLAGIAIAFGIMIDHAIIMVDYYRQYHSRAVITPLIGATLSTLGALSLLFLLPEAQQKNLVDFAKVIMLALASSIAVNLFFTAAMHDLLFKALSTERPQRNKKILVRLRAGYFSFISFGHRLRWFLYIGILLLFGIPTFLLPSHVETSAAYNGSFGSDYYQQSVAPLIDPLLGGTFRLFKQNVYEASVERNLGRTKLMMTVGMPIGTTIQQLDGILQSMETYLGHVKGIDQFITKISSSQSGTIEITFDSETEETDFPEQLKTELTRKAFEMDGLNWDIYGVGQGFNSRESAGISSLRASLRGYNYSELEKQAEKFSANLSKNPRILDVNTDEQPIGTSADGEFVFEINSQRSASSFANVSNILGNINVIATNNLTITSFQAGQELYQISLSALDADEFNKWDFLHSTRSEGTPHLPLSALGNVTYRKTASKIVRENRQYLRTVGCKFSGSPQLGRIYLAQQLKTFNMELPVGYAASSESFANEKETGNQQLELIILMLILNYIICAVLFENLRQPLIIIIMIPVSFIGLFLAFSLFDFTFDQGGYASFVMLGGLVTNAGIFIVNDFNRAHRAKNTQSFRRNKALISAIFNRARTILLTTIAAICGLVPFLLDGPSEPFWFCLAVGAIGGLIFSMFAIFFLLPVLLWKKGQTKKTLPLAPST